MRPRLTAMDSNRFPGASAEHGPSGLQILVSCVGCTWASHKTVLLTSRGPGTSELKHLCWYVREQVVQVTREEVANRRGSRKAGGLHSATTGKP